MKGFKTVGLGAALIALAIVSNEDVNAFLATHIDWYTGVVGTLVIVLRALTSSSIFQKSEK